MNQPILSHAELEGDHITMRPLAPEDADAGFGLIFRRPAILKWLVWKGPKDLADLRERFGLWRGRLDGGPSYRFALVERSSGSFIGTMGLRCAEPLFQVELGYWLAEEVWGKGYGTEAIRLADYLAFRHLSATVVTAEVFVGNQGSCRVLEKNGFQRQRTVRRVPELPPTDPGHERWIYTLTLGDFLRAEPGYAPRSERVETD